MKVVIAAGGRFHAFHLAHQLEKRGVLKRIYTAFFTEKDKDYISSRLVDQNDYFRFLSTLFFKLRFYKFLNKSKLHFLTDSLFDYCFSKKIEKEGKFDIFVGWANYFFNSLDKVKKSGAKIILESGSAHILEQRELLNAEYSNFGLSAPPIYKKNLEKILSEYDAADYIMTCSDFTYNSFIKHGISKDKILNVPYGVDLDLFGGKNKKNTDKFRVIFVGLICLRKGIPHLLKAWNDLDLPYEKIELLLVGNIQSDVKKFLKNFFLPKNVVFYGSVDRNTLSSLYLSSDIFVLPSIEEGFSMALMEAMASGLPVICTENTGGKDLIENGKNGFIIPIRDSQSLSKKILYFYDNKENCVNMGSYAKKKVQGFSWDVYGEKIFEIYKKII